MTISYNIIFNDYEARRAFRCIDILASSYNKIHNLKNITRFRNWNKLMKYVDPIVLDKVISVLENEYPSIKYGCEHLAILFRFEPKEQIKLVKKLSLFMY